jgi:hypothetical protein
MPRTVAEIDAEMVALSAKGVDGRAKQMRDLREERAAVIAAESPPPPTPDHSDFAGIGDSIEAAVAGDPLKSDEMRFIETCISKVELARDGNQTKLAKNLYQQLAAQVRIWRTMRLIVCEVGVGGEWPSWQSLGLRDGDGLPEAVKPVAPAPPRREDAVVIPPSGGVTMEAVQKMVEQATLAASDPVAQMKRGIQANVAREVGARPEPSTRKAPAPV